MEIRQFLERVVDGDLVNAREMMLEHLTVLASDEIDNLREEVSGGLLVTEEEALDEISKKVLGSYLKKAQSQMGSMDFRQDKRTKTREKREQGEHRAIRKLYGGAKVPAK